MITVKMTYIKGEPKFDTTEDYEAFILSHAFLADSSKRDDIAALFTGHPRGLLRVEPHPPVFNAEGATRV